MRLSTLLGELGISRGRDWPESFTSSPLSRFQFLIMSLTHVHMLRLVHRVVELEKERNCSQCCCYAPAAEQVNTIDEEGGNEASESSISD